MDTKTIECYMVTKTYGLSYIELNNEIIKKKAYNADKSPTALKNTRCPNMKNNKPENLSRFVPIFIPT